MANTGNTPNSSLNLSFTVVGYVYLYYTLQLIQLCYWLGWDDFEEKKHILNGLQDLSLSCN